MKCLVRSPLTQRKVSYLYLMVYRPLHIKLHFVIHSSRRRRTAVEYFLSTQVVRRLRVTLLLHRVMALSLLLRREVLQIALIVRRVLFVLLTIRLVVSRRLQIMQKVPLVGNFCVMVTHLRYLITFIRHSMNISKQFSCHLPHVTLLVRIPSLILLLRVSLRLILTYIVKYIVCHRCKLLMRHLIVTFYIQLWRIKSCVSTVSHRYHVGVWQRATRK